MEKDGKSALKCETCDNILYDGMVWQGHKYTLKEWTGAYGNMCVMCVAELTIAAQKRKAERAEKERRRNK